MAAILNAIRDGIHNVANGVRAANLSPEERRARAVAKQSIEMIKLAAVVSVVVTFLFFAIFPNLFTAALVGIAAYGAYEVSNVMNNLKEMHAKALVEARARLTQDNLVSQLTKGAPLSRSVIEMLNPDLSPLLLV